jgi:hypothetical protein
LLSFETGSRVAQANLELNNSPISTLLSAEITGVHHPTLLKVLYQGNSKEAPDSQPFPSVHRLIPCERHNKDLCVCVCMSALGFELRALCLLGRHSYCLSHSASTVRFLTIPVTAFKGMLGLHSCKVQGVLLRK